MMFNFERLYDLDNLYKSFLCVKKQSGWKEATQRYEENLLFNLINLSHKLKNGEYKPSKPIVFPYYERGKLRLIESYTVEDRIVQGCFVNEILMPLSMPKLAYDNCASIKNKGTSFFKRRLYKNLKQFSKQHGNNGYILKGDFTKYFDNLRHERFLSIIESFGADERTIRFAKMLLDDHLIDVSYMDDDEFATCMDVPFNSIEYYNNRYIKSGEKFMNKSMGIGSPIAQTGGIVGAYRVDNYAKIVRHQKFYARYMDDFYDINESKEELKDILCGIEQRCKEEGIFLNSKKTGIISLKHPFVLLKTTYFIKDDGTVVKKPNKKAFKRQRHKLNHFVDKLDADEMTMDDVLGSQKSWRGNIVAEFGVTKSVKSTDEYFNERFGVNYEQ